MRPDEKRPKASDVRKAWRIRWMVMQIKYTLGDRKWWRTPLLLPK